MAEFYVNSEDQADGCRAVHKNTCVQLPAKDTLLYLGSFGNKEAAYTKAFGKFANAVYCPACLGQ